MRYARVSTCMTAAGALLVLVQLASQLTGAELGTDSCVEINHLPTVVRPGAHGVAWSASSTRCWWMTVALTVASCPWPRRQR